MNRKHIRVRPDHYTRRPPITDWWFFFCNNVSSTYDLHDKVSCTVWCCPFPCRPLADWRHKIFYMVLIDLNSQKRNLFCYPDWLHSHDVQGVYSTQMPSKSCGRPALVNPQLGREISKTFANMPTVRLANDSIKDDRFQVLFTQTNVSRFI